jgi:hypothetical protein
MTANSYMSFDSFINLFCGALPGQEKYSPDLLGRRVHRQINPAIIGQILEKWALCQAPGVSKQAE